MNVGEYIKKLRVEAGLSQEELGKQLGVQRAAVQKWECGRVQNLKRDIIKKLAIIFNVPPASFIDNSFNSPGAYKKLFPDIFYRYDELSNDRQQEVISFMEFKLAQQKKQKEQEEIKALAEKAIEESENYELKKAIEYLDEKIAKGEFDPKAAKIAAYEGDIISPDKEREEWAADVMRLARLIEEEQSRQGDK